jgi:hypothetical protein
LEPLWSDEEESSPYYPHPRRKNELKTRQSLRPPLDAKNHVSATLLAFQKFLLPEEKLPPLWTDIGNIVSTALVIFQKESHSLCSAFLGKLEPIVQ